MSTLHTLASHPIPTDVAALSVSPEGRLEPRAHPLQIRFGFLGYSFAGTLIQNGGPPRLACSATVGTLPFTAEGADRRARVLSIVSHSQRARQGGRLSVDSHQRIRFDMEIELLSPLGPTSVIAAASDVAVAAQPWLSLLAQHGAPPPRT